MKNIFEKLHNNISTIIIDRPTQMNALNIETLKELEQAIINAIESKSSRGIIIIGAGKKSFVAGADINEFVNLSVDESFQFSLNGQRVFKLIEDSPKPVIAAINGYALGGGCELAMACHLRVASENAKFGQPESKLGIIPGYGGSQRLIQYIGKTKAMELMMTGEMITAQEAKELGLVNYVVTSEELISKAENLMNRVLLNSPIAIQAVINSVNAYYNENSDGFLEEANQFKFCFTHEDYKEGVKAFVEKREPNF